MILKENIPILQEVNLLEWHERGFNGLNTSVVLLDDGGIPREHMKDYYFNFLDNQGSIGHSTNVGYSAHTSAPSSKILAFDAKRDFDEAFEWLKNNKDKYDIINISLAGIGGSTTPQYEKLKELNKIILAASGNDAYNDKISYPANYDFIISIGAWAWKQDYVSSYSNGSENLDAVSPSGIYMLRDDGYIWQVQGTSFASPFACGMLACYIQWRNEHGLSKLTPEEAFEFIHSNCKDVEDVGFDFESGNGLFRLPSLEKLNQELIKPQQPEPTPPSTPSTPTPEQHKGDDKLPTQEKKKLYHVQTIPSAKLENAELEADKLKQLGFSVYTSFSNQVVANSTEELAKINSDKLTKAGIPNVIVYY